MPIPEYPQLYFKTSHEWSVWLAKNHDKANGVWLLFYKKSAKKIGINYAEALDEALCYGWIDSQSKSLNEESYLQKFTPRRSKSIWSKINTAKIEALIAAGKMKPAGMAQVTEAKKDGRWQNAYNSAANSTFPPEFLQALSERPKAKAFFEDLNKANKYAIAWRLETATKPATKLNRMKVILDMLERQESFH